MADENGATPNEEVNDVEETEEVEVTEEAPADELGEKGVKALQALKAERKELKRQLREARKEAEDLKASATKTDEPDVEAIRRDAEKAAMEKANARLLKAEVKAAAAGKLADPQDAMRFLDLSDFEVDSDGNVNASEIAEAIDDLITNKPYLAAHSRRFEAKVDTGARKATGPVQLTRDDLKGMTPEQIVAAEKAGQLNDLLGRK